MLLRLEVQHAQLVDYSIALGHGSCAYCDLLWSCQDLNREHRWKNRLMGRPFQPRKMPTSDAAIVNSAPGHDSGGKPRVAEWRITVMSKSFDTVEALLHMIGSWNSSQDSSMIVREYEQTATIDLRGRERAGFQRSAEVPTFTHDLVRSTDGLGNSFL